MPSSTDKKLILVIGATGAQGLAVIDKLLAPLEDGSPSPYAIRALTRDPENPRAKELFAKGVECVKVTAFLISFAQGRFDHFEDMAAALKGVYGAWVNIDGFTIGEPWEMYTGMRIFELAKQAGVKHYVWSNLDYAFKLGNYNETYRCQHYDAKGRVAEWMQAQPSAVSGTDMTWSVVTSGPYMDMLHNMMFGPLKKRENGTIVFATPVGNGHVPMIALSDMGFFARYTFDNRATASGQDLAIATEMVGWEHLKTTFEKVTGQKAEVVSQTIDDWLEDRLNFRGWWALWRDDIVKRDMEWIRKVNAKGHTLESWMREQNYGDHLWQKIDILKITEDGHMGILPGKERLQKL
ncbi:hypothetical protein POSPLADRAFT_1141351 [Postia placenta MAD-698-R-SB12]|uniref:NmrA-like domain-containing protein n=1 Tax=Postia placenta MAD-698-R-SB12 TaxID=670580 RepID=A0A1X6N1T7_9APHY|nr:hypothetical protein POSPLADRAFT_1141351 [Postia placenta MAD-698-R-SB12]OSX62577.1 hypothetical protein POSPLADRAFT_1141351 [Postia placenta MAD-698-R-SB12]